MPKVSKPKFVNRGPAGLLHKLTPIQKEALEKTGKQGKFIEVDVNAYPKDNICDALLDLVVSIDSLNPNPMNARTHTPRNIQAIKESLAIYGQMKPIVVRREGMIVVAGNGTLQVMKELGWTKVAAVIKDMQPIEAAGYGVADNRPSEFGRWNNERVKLIDEMLQAQNIGMPGYTSDELEVLRASKWLPPPINDTDFSREEKIYSLKFTMYDYEYIEKQVAKIKKRSEFKDKTREECLMEIIKEWANDGEYVPILKSGEANA